MNQPSGQQPHQTRLPELLAPAGDWDALQTAIHNGADAVYFGLDRFSARSAARNLTLDQLPEAMRFLHEHASRGFLALNTLLRNDECAAAVELAKQAYQTGIDAIIVQDLGLATILHRELPDLVLHASTQFTLSGGPLLDLARDLGLSRIVLPRELSGHELEVITKAAADKGIETEAFVHGALCISYSGQCLMSSLIGGRSGNRGACAQPCRLDYRLRQSEGALYSPRDQSLLRHLPELVATSLSSLKIEGRMRGPAYVGQVVAVYRQALDRLAEHLQAGQSLAGIQANWPDQVESDLNRLRQAFNRGGDFTDAYWNGRDYRRLIVDGMPGSHGIPVGQVLRSEPAQGVLTIQADRTRQFELNPGDVIAIRRPQGKGQDQAIASAPVGTSRFESGNWLVKGFHPDVMREIMPGDPVFRMSDHLAEQVALRADNRKTSIRLTLDDQSLTASVIAGYFSGKHATSRYQPTSDIAPLQQTRVIQQLRKTGGTAYQVDQVVVPEQVFLTIGQLNQLRRDVLTQLGDVLQGTRLITAKPSVSNGIERSNSDSPERSITSTSDPKSDVASTSDTSPTPYRSPHPPEIAVFYHQLPAQLSDLLCGADVYELPLLALDTDRIEHIAAMLREHEPQARLIVHWPPLTTGQPSEVVTSLLEDARIWPIDGVCAAWPADFDPQPAVDPIAHPRIRIADTSANLMNTASVLAALNRGANTICPSLELNGSQLIDLLDPLGKSSDPLPALTLERPIYGRLRLMATAYCPVGKNVPGCRTCVRSDAPDDSQLYPLVDRRGQSFMVLPHPRTCQADLLNCDLLAVPEEWQMIQQAFDPDQTGQMPFSWRSRLCFCEETAVERRELVAKSRTLLSASGSSSDAAAENWLKTARAIANRLDTRITSGHFQRGVQ